MGICGRSLWPFGSVSVRHLCPVDDQLRLYQSGSLAAGPRYKLQVGPSVFHSLMLCMTKLQIYRKGHFIVAEYVDKVTNKYVPNYPWQV